MTGKRDGASEYAWRLARIEDRWKFGLSALADMDPKGGVPTPFRAPHHTVSTEALMGRVVKGYQWRPGEMSLAHGGVLLLDQANEFRLQALGAVADAMKTGTVTLSIARSSTMKVPAEFRLIAVMQPCPCGFRGAPRNVCRCSDAAVERWMARAASLPKEVRVVPTEEWTSELAEVQASSERV